MDPKIFKAYDIRGIYPTQINEQVMERIIRGLYTFLVRSGHKKDLKIVCSRDMRLSSPALQAVAKETLKNCGAQVLDIGLNSTPSAYMATLILNADAGIQITASHNPKEYAGLKIVARNEDKIIKIGQNTGINEIKNFAMTNDFLPLTNDGSVIPTKPTLEKEIEIMADLVKLNDILPFKIVADAGNSMGAVYLDAIAKKYPINLIRLYFTLDGSFPNHEPNPSIPENVNSLKQKVKEEKADLGIITDGDGDRIMFVDEKGEQIEPTLITSLILNESANLYPDEKKYIVDIRYIRNVQAAAQQAGKTLLISRVGHAFITEQLNKEKAFFAGESSGHYFFQRTGGAEATIAIILFILKILSRERKPISQIVARFRKVIESGEINFTLNPGLNANDLLVLIQDKYSDGVINRLDGVAVDYPNWRFGVRTSNTEPLVRLNIEGESKELVAKKIKELSDLIISFGAKLKTASH